MLGVKLRQISLIGRRRVGAHATGVHDGLPRDQRANQAGKAKQPQLSSILKIFVISIPSRRSGRRHNTGLLGAQGRRFSGTRVEATKRFCQSHRGNTFLILSPEVLISNPCWEPTTDLLARFRAPPRDKETPFPCASPHSIPRQTSV
jgi:hypothetical protein